MVVRKEKIRYEKYIEGRLKIKTDKWVWTCIIDGRRWEVKADNGSTTRRISWRR